MRRTSVSAVRPLSGGLAFIVALTLSPSPVCAGDLQTSPRPAKTSRLAIAAMNAARTAAEPVFAQKAATPESTPPDHTPFLKTTKGKVAIVLFVAGAGWAIYSAKHDREPVKSPIRRGGLG